MPGNRLLVTKPKILVVGSSNTDMVIKGDFLPGAGETVAGGTFFMNPGGKGANQAVAAARLNGNISFICKTGNDIFGRKAIQVFQEEGIDTRLAIEDPVQPSGIALIMVDNKGENCISVALGANAGLLPIDLLPAMDLIGSASIILMQLEIPLETVVHLAALASDKGLKFVLNPAPACELPDELLQKTYIITPNSTEAEMLTGIKVVDIDSAKLAAQKLKERGVKNVIITLGKSGALVLHEDVFTHVPASKVEAVDSTAAGDVFNGALVVALSEGRTIPEATEFAARAAAISVTRLGAQSSAPYRSELENLSS